MQHTTASTTSQHQKLLAYLGDRGIARAFELREIGVSATALSRAVEAGDVIRIGRGLYQAANAEVDLNANLAEIAKRVPRAVICLVSALAFHGLTDQLPRQVWFAIGAKDWAPSIDYPPVRVVRFREPYHSSGIETHTISGVQVPIYSVPKSLADAFRNPKLIDRSVALEALKSALTHRKATPAVLMQAATDYGAARIMRPYLEALTSNG
jgi:predicted transcriptional regulator of viral defense system